MKNQPRRSSSAPVNTTHSIRARQQNARKSASLSLTPEAVEGLRLIAIYNLPYTPKSLRENAARALVDLVDRHVELLELVIADAQKYAKLAHVCDFSPYVPNSFAVLANLQCKDTVVSFLEEIVRQDYGIPRWEALEALCLMETAEADRVLEKVILGHYAPAYVDPKIDKRLIESVKTRVVSTMNLEKTSRKKESESFHEELA